MRVRIITSVIDFIQELRYRSQNAAPARRREMPGFLVGWAPLLLLIPALIAAIVLTVPGGSTPLHGKRVSPRSAALSFLGASASQDRQAALHAEAQAAVPVTLPVTPAVPLWPRSYTLRAGDTLMTVARREYGPYRGAWWTQIYWANHTVIRYADVIAAGTHLTIPAPAPSAPAAPAQLDPAPPPVPSPAVTTQPPAPAPSPATQAPQPSGSGQLSPAQVGAYWLGAGGPAWAEQAAESVAMCESGDNTNAQNPSGATGLWQILGQVVPGDLFDPAVNAANAVSKFNASGQTWAQWTCQP
jgi:phage tail protein X